MITSVIIFIIWLTIVYIIEKKYDKGITPCWVFVIMFGLFLSILTPMLLGLIVKPEIRTETSYTRIANIQDNITTEGSFFLGTGSIEGETYYYYYYSNIYDGYSLGKIKTSKAYIKYSDKTPVMVTTSYYFKSDNAKYWYYITKHDDIYFNVPRGSIKVGYNLDAK